LLTLSQTQTDTYTGTGIPFVLTSPRTHLNPTHQELGLVEKGMVYVKGILEQ
jgi:hypothetical protein